MMSRHARTVLPLVAALGAGAVGPREQEPTPSRGDVIEQTLRALED